MNLSLSYQAEDADPFLMPRGQLCKEKQNNILYSQGLAGWPASAHEGFGLRELLKVSHKDSLSPLRPGVKTRGTRHKKRVVCMSRQPANSVKAAVGEKS